MSGLSAVIVFCWQGLMPHTYCILALYAQSWQVLTWSYYCKKEYTYRSHDSMTDIYYNRIYHSCSTSIKSIDVTYFQTLNTRPDFLLIGGKLLFSGIDPLESKTYTDILHTALSNQAILSYLIRTNIAQSKVRYILEQNLLQKKEEQKNIRNWYRI